MRSLERVEVIVAVGLAWIISVPCAHAEDTKGKWQFGFGISYYSTVDYIRSNADLAISSGVVDENGLPNVGSVDERPDINIMNQASIHDDFKLDFTGSYGVTRWFALEAGVSYMNAPVGNIEFYFANTEQGISAPQDQALNGVKPACGPNGASPGDCWDWTPGSPTQVKNNTFLPVGTITEIPIHLSGLIRFRPESPLNPYIGLGFGYILTDLKHADEFNKDAAIFSNPNFIVSTADEGEYTINTRSRRENGGIPFNFHPNTLEASVSNTWEWHAIGGVDYHTSEHVAMYVDARYIWTQGSVDIRTDGAHQVRFGISDPGTLVVKVQAAQGKTFDPNDPTTYYLWEDIGVPANQHFHDLCPQCQNDGYLETEDGNLDGALDGHEDDGGILYKVPPCQPGLPCSRTILDEAVRIVCPTCANNQTLDTEDANGNGFLDRYLLYGVDICTTAQGVGNPKCTPDRSSPTPRYVWPEGCSQSPITLAPFQALTESGCPAFLQPHVLLDQNQQPVIDPVTQKPILVYDSIRGTNADNAADTYIVQGGRIRMGGFSLGFGIKFSF
jgi:outer membrane protein W